MVLPQRVIRPASRPVIAPSGGSHLALGRTQCKWSLSFQFGRLVRQLAVLVMFVPGLSLNAQASAQAYVVRSQGGWTIAPSSDAPGCFLTREYGGAGGTTLLFGVDVDGKNHLSMLNDNWSIRPKDRLALNFRLSGRGYPKQIAVGMASNGKRGFVTSFAPEFELELASSKFLYVDRGDVPVARIMLDGSGPALAELKRCIAAVSAELAAEASARSGAARVPKDPFAADIDKRSRKHRSASRKSQAPFIAQNR